MRILILCHRLPFPPTKGDKLRSFREIEYLSRRHHIHLLTLADPDVPGNPEEGLEEYCSRVEVFPFRRLAARGRSLMGLFTTVPMTLSYFRSTALARRVQQLETPANFDVALICGSAMAQYAPLVPRLPRLLDMVDVDSAKWMQYSQVAAFPRNWIWGLEARRMKAYETTLLQMFDKIVLTTSHEVQVLGTTASVDNVEVVRNGVDLDPRVARSRRRRSIAPTLVFVGQMDYFANIDGVVHFSREILPRLRVKFPDLEFLIVGRSPATEVLDLSKIPGVTVTGEVEDVRQYLADAWIFVAPLRIAQGVQNKVLEAMAMGIPTVVSTQVMNGLTDGGFVEGKDLLVAADDKQTEMAIERLLGERSLGSDLATSAHARLADRYSWSANMASLERHLEELARPAGRVSVDSGAPAAMRQPS